MISFSEIVDNVISESILLPDFQRSFVWRDIDRQSRLLGSVFARLPIGSILLLEGSTSEFSSKKIGRKTTISFDNEVNKKYLLDGQQRITVLVNALSDHILSSGPLNDLVSPSLKVRFFLKVKKFDDFKTKDIFGYTNLLFPFDPNGEPDFLAEQVTERIESKTTVNDAVHGVGVNLETIPSQLAIISSSVSNSRVPLFLLTSRSGKNIAQSIIEELARCREEELNQLCRQYFNETDKEPYMDFLVSLSSQSSDQINQLKHSEDVASNALKNMKRQWARDFMKYLDLSLDRLKLNKIDVERAQRARAIDIYENLNMGGISLSTFDLIVAKAAKINNTNFYDMFVDEMGKPLTDQPSFIPEMFSFQEWNSVKYTQSYIEKKSEANPSFLNVFINLLSIHAKIIRTNDYSIVTDDIKRETILALTSEEILNYYKVAIRGINRALCFAQFKLGIRKINDIKYEHVLLLLSYFLNIDTIWSSQSSLKKLEYWYWVSIFAGCYDKDQTEQMISDFHSLYEILVTNTKQIAFYSQQEQKLFSEYYFTNKEILLMEQAHLNNMPKEVVKQTIMQFILSRKPVDFLGTEDNPQFKLHAWDLDHELEAHHILPLNSAASIFESTKGLRADKENMLNSPMNFTFILAQTNNKIGPNSLTQYFSMINNAVIASHVISPLNADSQENHRLWLSTRYDYFKSTLMQHLGSLID